MNVLDNDEKPLRKNVSSILERSMQTAHFEIVQLAANMNKLTGMHVYIISTEFFTPSNLFQFDDSPNVCYYSYVN